MVATPHSLLLSLIRRQIPSLLIHVATTIAVPALVLLLGGSWFVAAAAAFILQVALFPLWLGTNWKDVRTLLSRILKTEYVAHEERPTMAFYKEGHIVKARLLGTDTGVWWRFDGFWSPHEIGLSELTVDDVADRSPQEAELVIRGLSRKWKWWHRVVGNDSEGGSLVVDLRAIEIQNPHAKEDYRRTVQEPTNQEKTKDDGYERFLKHYRKALREEGRQPQGMGRKA